MSVLLELLLLLEILILIGKMLIDFVFVCLRLMVMLILIENQLSF